jgi:hypothetical protein
MTEHPTSEWEWEDTAEVAFQKWFHDLYGGFSLRSEYFFGDCEVEDVNTRKDLMYKWVHSAFVMGYNMGRMEMTDEQLLNSLQGTMATIDPYSVKKEAIDEYRIDTIEERLTRIEDKVDLLITQLKIEFYKKNDGTSR